MENSGRKGRQVTGQGEVRQLPEIPVVDGRIGGPASVVAALPGHMQDLMLSATGRYGRVGLARGDTVSRRWLTRNKNPYLAELEATAKALGRPGAVLLNVSYDWACTTGTCPADGGGHLMVRVLDWDLGGLGRNLCAIRQAGEAGEWLNLGWPGFSGAITAMAQGRFAAAINQPPLEESSLGSMLAKTSWKAAMAADWFATKPGTWRSTALPPAHLLRKVFDEAPDWKAAVDMLLNTPISTPAFFTLAGPGDGQGCVVERTRDGGVVRMAEPVVAVANHWDAFPQVGIPRGAESVHRQELLTQVLGSGCNPFAMAWLAPPILNSHTRLVAVADPATGRLSVQGWEDGEPATVVLSLPPI